MTSRQTKLAKVFSEDGGAMGLYAQCFIDHVGNSGTFEELMREHVTEPFENKKFKGHRRKRRIYKSQLLEDRKENLLRIAWMKTSIAHETHAKIESISGQMHENVRRILIKLRNSFFEDHSNTTVKAESCPHSKYQKLSNKEFTNAAIKIFQDAGDFVNSPSLVIHEAHTSMMQALKWLCMWSKTPEDITVQMRAALEPTITHPKTGKKISPIEMLGYGNNGFIGSEISLSFPMTLNFRQIVKQAKGINTPIISPNFVKLWFDRDLEIGGCPAQVHKRRTDNVYMDFARMYVECAEKILQHSAELAALQTMNATPSKDDLSATIIAE